VTAVIVFNIIAVVRWFVPLERKWLFIPPLTITVLAVALAWLIETDKEKIEKVVSVATQAVKEQRSADLGLLISPDYSDPVHRTREDFTHACRLWLGRVKLDNAAVTDLVLEIQNGKATALIEGVLRFGKKPGADDYLSGMAIPGKVRVTFEKTAGGKWLMRSTELLEIMNQPASWQRVNF
jgi:hypothetical protein